MRKFNYTATTFLILVLLLTACGGSDEVGVEGVWREKQDCGLYPLRGFPKVEFLEDRTAITYNIVGGKESSGIVGEYTPLDDNRIKIVWSEGRFTDILKHTISDDTLTLCDGDWCCDYQPENQQGSKPEDSGTQQPASQNQIDDSDLLAEETSTPAVTESSPAQEPNPGQTPFRLIGYDLRQIETRDGWTTYAINVAIENISGIAQSVNIPVTEAYVETLNGETYPVELYLTRRIIYSDLITPPIVEAKETIEPLTSNTLAPSALVLDQMRWAPPETALFGPGRMWLVWALSFKIPENSRLNKLVVPEASDIELTNVVVRKDMKLPDLADDQEMPISFMANDYVEVTISNPRLSEDSEYYGKMFAFDMDLENKDTSQSNTVNYIFTVIDPRGTWLTFNMTDCLVKKDRTDALPLFEIELDPGQKVGGYVCTFLNPTGYYEGQQVRVLDTVGELDPRELGLNPDNIMKVEGIEGTFKELRAGIETPDGKIIQWVGNKKIGKIIIQERGRQETLPPLLRDTYQLYIEVGENLYMQAIRLDD